MASGHADNAIEQRTQEIGRELLAETRGGGALTRKFWSDKLIAWALADEAFKVELFRFIDVFPVLRGKEEVHRHLVEYLDRPGLKLPAGMGMGIKAGGIFKGALAATIASQIEGMAANFIAGKDVADALPVLESRWREGMGFSVDLLGEACLSHAEADIYRGRYLELVEKLAAAAKRWEGRSVLEGDHLGAVPRVNVSVKISAMDGHVSPVDAEGTVSRLVKVMEPLLQRAGELGVLINFDMEHHALKELTFELFKRCCEKYAFDAGIALQAYLTSAEADARELMAWARRAGRVVTVRLIKGAYWDYETIHAELMGWPKPVWGKKGETDACFERVAEMLIRETPRKAGHGGVKVALGTHNVRSVAWGMACVETSGLPKKAVEFQALRGMAEELKTAVVKRGWRMREYVPVGEMIPGMAYLVRRLLENTSNEGWVRKGAGEANAEELLRKPEAGNPKPEVEKQEASSKKREEFRNEAVRDFSEHAARENFAEAAKRARVPVVKNDATVENAREAVGRALAAYPEWRDLAAKKRAEIILRAAEILRGRRDELAGVMIKEAGKTWGEADGDVCEAIDFCEFYAREAVALAGAGGGRRLGDLAGEINVEVHEGRGVAAVISPWNFPLSICTGMTVAALVTGNSAVVKPAEQTPGIAKLLCEALWEAGVPRQGLHFLPGVGETVGAALVRDPRVAVVAFTGSKAVGLEIVRECGETPPEQLWVKRAICEMGGKNAIIVDASADLDEAVVGVGQSAFGFAGQKCSAGSRVIVVDPSHPPAAGVHDVFVRRLVEATRALVLGDPLLPETDIGPVIDDDAAKKIRGYIDIGMREAVLAYPAGPQGNGRLIAPHIFTCVKPEHRIAREEIFGSVLAVLRARDFEEALRMANDSSYKLTGGIYSRTPSHIERARREFRVGNLYINRGITGALVGRQPFGGFGLSGVGAKAGGHHYLLQFTDTRIVTENTMRRGFAPGRTT